MDRDIATIDSLLDDLGGCGLFQFINVASIDWATLPVAWSIVFMAFAAYNPGWMCGDSAETNSNATTSTTIDPLSSNGSATSQNDSWSQHSCKGYSQCDNIIFNGDASTIVTEWNLACDHSYILKSITSIQMAGLLLGALFAGQLSNAVGRKPTHFLLLTAMCGINLLMAFSMNWKLFAAGRFFLGIAIGGVLITSIVYQMEFVARKWRSIVSLIPVWNIAVLLFAVAAMVLRNWRHLHVATSLVTALMIIPVVWVPESIRWLAVKGKTEKACRVARKIARLNGKGDPNMGVIYFISEEEKKREEKQATITVLDLYKGKYLKRTIVIAMLWFGFSMVYYAIVFDIKSLSGDFYVNLMIGAIITPISFPIASFLANKIGRRYCILIFIGLDALCFLCLLCFNLLSVDKDNKDLAVQILTFSILTFTHSAWLTTSVFTSELYPTMLRSLGFGNASSFSRVGAMIAPFLFPKDPSIVYVSYIVMIVYLGIGGICLSFLPETGNREMEDTMNSFRKTRANNAVSDTNKETEVIALTT